MKYFKEIYKALRAGYERGILERTQVDYTVKAAIRMPAAFLLGDHEEEFVMNRDFSTSKSLSDRITELDRTYLKGSFMVKSAYLFGEPVGVVLDMINEEVKLLAKRLKYHN